MNSELKWDEIFLIPDTCPSGSWFAVNQIAAFVLLKPGEEQTKDKRQNVFVSEHVPNLSVHTRSIYFLQFLSATLCAGTIR